MSVLLERIRADLTSDKYYKQELFKRWSAISRVVLAQLLRPHTNTNSRRYDGQYKGKGNRCRYRR